VQLTDLRAFLAGQKRVSRATAARLMQALRT
jgi:hypothetical protein